ncbi:MAG: hypothetical protein ACR65R_07210 [Methylomicrobium sp.]
MCSYGASSVPLRSRLVDRTQAVVGAADRGLVAFFGSPSSRGSLLACRCALSRGLPVVAFPVGFPGSELPLLRAGSWVPCCGFGGYAWAAKQKDIFTYTTDYRHLFPARLSMYKRKKAGATFPVSLAWA